MATGSLTAVQIIQHVANQPCSMVQVATCTLMQLLGWHVYTMCMPFLGRRNVAVMKVGQYIHK